MQVIALGRIGAHLRTNPLRCTSGKCRSGTGLQPTLSVADA
jgi:hypothetical protein